VCGRVNFWTINFSILYVLALFGISIFFARKAVASYEDYNLCGRSLTFAYVVMTYFGTWVGGGTIIGLVGLSYATGLGNYWIMSIPYLVGFPFAFLFITRIRKLKQYSIGDMMALRYPDHGEIVRIPVAAAVLIRNITVIGMQFSAISLLLSFVFGIDRNLAILLIFIVITAYTALSGLWGIVGTDILQGLLQAVGLILLLTQTYELSGGWVEASRYFSDIGHADYLQLIDGPRMWAQIGVYILTIGLFFLMGDQGDWQKINSCKSDRIAFWGFLMPVCVAMIWLLIPAYVGIFQRVTMPVGSSPSAATFEMILNMFSTFTGAFVIVCLLAAVTSSADSYLLAAGMTMSRDIIKKFMIKDSSDGELIFWSRFFVVIAGGMGFAIAICISDLISLWMTGLIVSTSIMLVPYLSAWFSRRLNTAGAIAGMAAGGISSIVSLFLFGAGSVEAVWIGIFSNAAVSLAVRIATVGPDPANIAKTYYWSDTFENVRNIP